MKCKYKASEFKKGQMLLLYRHPHNNKKLWGWSAIITKQEFDLTMDMLEGILAEIIFDKKD